MDSSPQSPEGRGAQLMKTPERFQSTISVQDYAKTGSDRAAGRATWTAALVITAILVPWALCCRGLRSVAGGLRRPVSAVAAAVLVVFGVLTVAVRRASSALTAVIRGPSAALRAIVRSSLRRCARPLAGLLTDHALRCAVGDVSSDKRRAGARKGARPSADNGEDVVRDRLLSMARPVQTDSPRGTSRRLAGAGARTKGGDSPAAGRSGRPHYRAQVGAGCCRSKAGGLPRRSCLLPKYPSAATHGAGACPVGFGSRGCGGLPAPHYYEGPDRGNDLVRAD